MLEKRLLFLRNQLALFNGLVGELCIIWFCVGSQETGRRGSVSVTTLCLGIPRHLYTHGIP